MAALRPLSTLTETERWKNRGQHFILLAQKLLREHDGIDREARLGLALQKIEFRAHQDGYRSGRKDGLKQLRLLLFMAVMVGISVGFLLA